MLKQNVDRKSVIDREIRAIKSQSRYNFTVLAPNGDNRIFRIGSPDDKSSIFTFNDNHNDVEDIDYSFKAEEIFHSLSSCLLSTGFSLD